MVTPPTFCAGYSANRSATASAHLPPKYPSCRGVTQGFAKSFSGQHGQPKYLSKRMETSANRLTTLGMRHSFCRRPKRSTNGPRSASMSAFGPKRTSVCALQMSAFGGKADIVTRNGSRGVWSRCSHHPHLVPELGREDRLRDEGMNAAYDVDDLRHAEAHGDAAQGIGVELADLRLGRQKLDRIACRHRHRHV